MTTLVDTCSCGAPLSMLPRDHVCATPKPTGLEAAQDGEAWPRDAGFQLGELVQKKGRASWRGKIVGWYRTDLTALGFAVESIFEPGSVQIYPASALEPLAAHSVVPSEGMREALEIAERHAAKWRKEAARHTRKDGRRSDCGDRDEERARICDAIANDIRAALRTDPAGGEG